MAAFRFSFYLYQTFVIKTSSIKNKGFRGWATKDWGGAIEFSLKVRVVMREKLRLVGCGNHLGENPQDIMRGLLNVFFHEYFDRD
jgi:hypothetical protein